MKHVIILELDRWNTRKYNYGAVGFEDIARYYKQGGAPGGICCLMTIEDCTNDNFAALGPIAYQLPDEPTEIIITAYQVAKLKGMIMSKDENKFKLLNYYGDIKLNTNANEQWLKTFRIQHLSIYDCVMAAGALALAIMLTSARYMNIFFLFMEI